MRKQTKSKTPKKNEDSKQDMILVSAIVGIVAIFGVIMYFVATSASPSEKIETLNYNGFVFEKHGDVWTTLLRVGDKLSGKYKEYEVYFHFTPADVEDIPTIKNSRNDTVTTALFMQSNLIYITTDPEYPASVILGGVEIAKVLGQIYQKEVKATITRPGKTGALVVTCENISNTVRVIDLRLGNTTAIYNNNGCIIVQGRDSIELLKASERLTFEMLKIL
ncbi:MAG: hypothetical protein ABIJ34_00955 [archaeon]